MTFDRRILIVPILVLAVLPAAGCGKQARTDYLAPERLDRGLVMFLDGIGGWKVGPQWIRTGLSEADLGYAMHIFDWGHGPGGMFVADLWDEQKKQRDADHLARLVTNYRKYYPGRRLALTGHSGGAGIVVFALERLPDDVTVDEVFLLAPALSPDHNLARALRHVEGHVLTTYSGADVPLMGVGTSIFATMDGKHTVSAGLVGFRLPENLSAADARQYKKVYTAGWSAELLKRGHLGGHMGWSTPWFAREYIAPVIAGAGPDPVFRPMIGGADSPSPAAAEVDGERGTT